MHYKILGESFSLWAILGYLINLAPAVAGLFAIVYYYYAIKEKQLNIKITADKKKRRDLRKKK